MSPPVDLPEDLTLWIRFKALVLRNKYMFAKLCSVVIGLVLGIILDYTVVFDLRHLSLLELPGNILINALQLISTPLIVTSVTISAALQLPHVSLKKAGRALAFFMFTSFTAVIIGLVMAVLIRPGSAYARDAEEDESPVEVIDFLFDLGSNLVPQNLLAAGYYMFQTATIYLDENGTATDPETAVAKDVVGKSVDGPNTMGLIVWSFIFGLALRNSGTHGESIIAMLEYWNGLIKDVVDLILWYLPFGTIFLVASSIAGIEDWQILGQLVLFIVSVVVGLILQCIVVVSIYTFKTGHNPVSVLHKMLPALVTAFLISSSSATLPITMQACESALHIDRRVSRIVLPVGTNINKDGTALYEMVAVMFIAQLNNIQLSATEIITACVIAFVTSIGAPSIPATGAASTRLVLASVGLPAGDAVLLVPIEWFLDRLNTVVNVLGDCYCTELVYELMIRDHSLSTEQEEEAQIEQGEQDREDGREEDQVEEEDESGSPDVFEEAEERPPSSP